MRQDPRKERQHAITTLLVLATAIAGLTNVFILVGLYLA